MLLFIFGIVMLVVGYYTYGAYVESVLAPDARETPAVRLHNGVDFLVLPKWKNMLIQLLNIAGIGPVIGVILGIKFGSIVFLLIPLGNIIGGAVHDYLCGMMSLRSGGANLPQLIREQLGSAYYRVFGFFACLLLLLVVTVFINVPAKLVADLFPGHPIFWVIVGAIFVYYAIATIFPIDVIIGRFYPFFGGMLLLGTGAIFLSLLWHGNKDLANFMVETEAFKAGMTKDPILPCLFVTIACGIISGFHATQSPIVARTMATEREARPTYYGMMVVEGLIGMTWAGAGMAVYNLKPELMTKDPMIALSEITNMFLNGPTGIITILAVVVLAITSGDTALRSLRLSIAEMFHIDQARFISRFLICLPLFILIVICLWWSNQNAETFNILWKYFSWGNQVLAASTLLAATVWLLSLGKNALIAAIPGAFMTFIVLTFILWTSPAHKGPIGFGLPLATSYWIASGLTVLIVGWQYYRGMQKSIKQKNNEIIEEEIITQRIKNDR